MAWAKLLYFRDRGETEISGFGVTPADDLLFVKDFVTVSQETTVASISLDDGAVADFFDAQVDAGLRPVQFGRLWIHTHPGNSPEPSCTDEETFARVFGSCEHALMVIVARGGKSYARLRFNVGPGGDVVIPIYVDYSRPFPGSDLDAWEAEYTANIVTDWPYQTGDGPVDLWDNTPYGGRRAVLPVGVHPDSGAARTIADSSDTFGSASGLDQVTVAELAEMDESEREYVLAELGISGDQLGLDREGWL
jgi:proteasome lid subunit RPN8/RPN11